MEASDEVQEFHELVVLCHLPHLHCFPTPLFSVSGFFVFKLVHFRELRRLLFCSVGKM